MNKHKIFKGKNKGAPNDLDNFSVKYFGSAVVLKPPLNESTFYNLKISWNCKPPKFDNPSFQKKIQSIQTGLNFNRQRLKHRISLKTNYTVKFTIILQ